MLRGPVALLLNCLALVLFPALLPAQSSPSVRIGLIQSLTGVAAQDGNTVVRAARLAADALSREGTQVVLEIEDDASDPKSAVSAYRRLQANHVDAIIGATWSATTNALAGLARNDRTVILNTSTLPEGLNYQDSGGYLFSNALALHPETAPFGDYLKSRKVKTAVLIQNGSAWGEAQAQRHKELLKEYGVTLLREFKGLHSDNNSWDDVMPRLKADSADVIIVLSGRLDTERVLRKQYELQITSLFFGSKNTLDAFRLGGNKSIFGESVCFTYPMEQLQSTPEFYLLYEKSFGETPTIYADSSYDAVFILTQAIREARTSGTEIREALKNTSFAGITGKYRFSEPSSLGGGKSSLVCFKAGEPRVVTGGK